MVVLVSADGRISSGVVAGGPGRARAARRRRALESALDPLGHDAERVERLARGLLLGGLLRR
ncbi:MAG TPA: hypothetical protein VFV62_07160, partial [Gaiellaceae bacterium]|nr:hypothetical protein [Gaiellaceae bacterium]